MLSSDELAIRLGLARGTVMHHMNKLMDSGIVITRNSKYMLRVDNLKELVEMVERDIERTLKSLKVIAEDIDNRLGL